jgi:hypothetical protein
MKVKLAKLVQDFNVYPRAAINPANVESLVMALEAKVVLPRIIADKKTLRIVDGFHRHEAYKQWAGLDTEVEVELRSYRSDKELFLDAIRCNAAHGLGLSTLDRKLAVEAAQKFKLDPKLVAAAMNMTVQRVNHLVPAPRRTLQSPKQIQSAVEPARTKSSSRVVLPTVDPARDQPKENETENETEVFGFFEFQAVPDGSLLVSRIEKPTNLCWNIVAIRFPTATGSLKSGPVQVEVLSQYRKTSVNNTPESSSDSKSSEAEKQPVRLRTLNQLLNDLGVPKNGKGYEFKLARETWRQKTESLHKNRSDDKQQATELDTVWHEVEKRLTRLGFKI